jgi:hypothetical protein
VGVAVEVIGVVVLLGALLLLGDVLCVAFARYPRSDYGIGGGYALEIRHVVVFILFLGVVVLLLYLLMDTLPDLL